MLGRRPERFFLHTWGLMSEDSIRTTWTLGSISSNVGLSLRWPGLQETEGYTERSFKSKKKLGLQKWEKKGFVFFRPDVGNAGEDFPGAALDMSPKTSPGGWSDCRKTGWGHVLRTGASWRREQDHSLGNVSAQPLCSCRNTS